MNKQLRIFLIFFILGLALIIAGFSIFHIIGSVRVTTEEVVNPKATINLVMEFFRAMLYSGFVVWACYPAYLVYRLIRRGAR